ncbi:MAG: GAF domain-containing protein, partial [Myxococcales bacterium]
ANAGVTLKVNRLEGEAGGAVTLDGAAHDVTVLGALKLARTTDRRFTREELRGAEILASQISIKLDNARLYSEARRHVHLLSGLFNVSRIGAEASEVGPLVRRVLDQVLEVLHVDAGTIHLAREGRLHLAGHSAQPGSGIDFERGELRELVIDEQSLCGRAARERRTWAASFFSRPDLFSAAAREMGIRHAVAVPLVGGDRLLGTFWVGRREEKPFDVQEVQLLESCAAHVSVAIENARLFEAERRRVGDLSLINEVGEAIGRHLALPNVLSTGVQNVARITEVPNAYLMLCDPSDGSLRLAATNMDDAGMELVIPAGQPSAAGAAVEQLKPVVIEDVSAYPRASPELVRRFGHRSMMAIPLLESGRPIGAMVLADRVVRRFTSQEIDRAVAVSNQIASAVSNARHFETERKRVQDLRLLLEVGRVITGSLDLDEILEGSVASLAGIADASHAFIWLLDPASQSLRGAATSLLSFRQDFRSARMPLDAPSSAAEAVRTRAAVRIFDATTSPLVNQTLRERYGQKSLLALPLLLRDEPIGAVVIGDAERQRDWAETEIERVTVMARQVAVAVANARLFEDLKQSYDTLARTQQELVKRERLAALGELAAVVAHEVRNPLGVIFNSLGPIRKSLVPGSNGAMLLDIVSEEADRLNRIVGDLLDFARPTEPSFLAESLESLLSGACDAVTTVAQENGVKVLSSFEALPLVRGDARMLRQAFINLVTNAVQAMPRGGTVTVRATEEVRGGRVGARVEVADTGPGIPPHLLDRIFQPFFTTKASGTGLGLAVVKRIIDRHSGELWVDSKPGAGSTFTVWLPS